MPGYGPDKPENEKKEPKFKLPEFIDIEEETGKEEKFSKEEIYEIFQKLPLGYYPLQHRLLMLFLSILTLVISGFFLFFFVISLIFSIATFFKLKMFKSNVGILWKNARRMAALSVGFAVAVLSPPFGIGIIMLYFILYQDKAGTEFFEKIIGNRG